MKKIEITEEYYNKELENVVKVINMFQEQNNGDDVDITDESISILESNLLILLNMLEDPTRIIEILFENDPEYKNRIQELMITLSLEKMIEKGLIVKLLNEDGNGEPYYMDAEEYEKTIGKDMEKIKSRKKKN